MGNTEGEGVHADTSHEPSTLRTLVYVIRGRIREFGSAGAVTDAVKVYDVSGDRWVLLDRTGHDLWQGSGGFIGGKLFLIDFLDLLLLTIKR